MDTSRPLRPAPHRTADLAAAPLRDLLLLRRSYLSRYRLGQRQRQPLGLLDLPGTRDGNDLLDHVPTGCRPLEPLPPTPRHARRRRARGRRARGRRARPRTWWSTRPTRLRRLPETTDLIQTQPGPTTPWFRPWACLLYT